MKYYWQPLHLLLSTESLKIFQGLRSADPFVRTRQKTLHMSFCHLGMDNVLNFLLKVLLQMHFREKRMTK